MRSAIVLLLGSMSLCLGCVGVELSEDDPTSGHEAPPPDAAGGFVPAPSCHSRGEALYADAYRPHHDPGQGQPVDDDEPIGAAAAACWWWGPTPHGIVAEDAENVAAQ